MKIKTNHVRRIKLAAIVLRLWVKVAGERQGKKRACNLQFLWCEGNRKKKNYKEKKQQQKTTLTSYIYLKKLN